VTSTWKVAGDFVCFPATTVSSVPAPSNEAALPVMVAALIRPRTAMSVNPGKRDEPAIRQLKCPCTAPFSTLTEKPKSENGFVPSTVPRPPPLATAPWAAGANTAAAKMVSSATRAIYAVLT
jgi:hypothetical protein